MSWFRRQWLAILAVVFCSLTCTAQPAPAVPPDAKAEVGPADMPKAGEPAPEGRPISEPAPKAPDQNAPAAADAPKTPLERGVWDLIRASGTVGLCIIGLSVAAFALTLEYFVTIRRGSLMPHGLAQELHHHITHGQFTDAEQACKRRASYLAYVVLAGLQEVRFGYPAVEKAMEDASTEQATRLFRKVEYLGLIANLAPMLGLLGTVYGILLAFKKVAETRGAALAADLADGVYLALVTTVEGLVVAIPALGVYAIFRNRIEQLTSEVQLVAEQVFINYKRGRMARRHDQPADSLL